jgi:hypothetical protein
MAKSDVFIEISCGGCNKQHGLFTKKAIPKKFVCEFCGLGQTSEIPNHIPYSKGRNYPPGHFENS